ncbi:hypothetical protein CAAN1_12S04412 [[Candida] anglica]|uniref:GATA-type domain-containing protein n=1 Tax=[Candida] anglica TaxID=148631 RepID=A0ABP0E9F0_9ASCO
MSDEYKRMQVKVLYSFNNNATVFLSRSKQMHSIKIAQIPMANEGEVMTLGAFDLKTCVSQVLKSSPENFKMQTEDYAVYYKDITEQPDEPFVANGVLSSLISTSKQQLIPGRVCQNLSASFLFGDKANTSSLTLEIRLKLLTIEKGPESNIQTQSQPQIQQTSSQVEKRSASNINEYNQQKRSRINKPSVSATSSSAAVKATRTKSLPIFYPQNQQIFNIINADKSNAPSKYDNKSVQDRFKSAPFLQPKILENPQRRYNGKIVPLNQINNNNKNEPQRAMRTRSMIASKQMPMTVSSPINEETDGSDTDYQETTAHSEDGQDDIEEEDEVDDFAGNSSPYTPQQPPYKPMRSHQHRQQLQQSQSQQQSASSVPQFQSLPDLEDLDSRKTHAIPHSRLPKNHGLVCMNSNCAATTSITWRYFETGYHPNYLSLHRAKDFDIKHYDGMIGPLCNACYLFLRNKGFMRPEAVVKKYMQQQRYKKELRQKDELLDQQRQSSLGMVASKGPQYASSPIFPQSHKFTTPTHTPSAINQVIQNNQQNMINGNNKLTPNYHNYNDLNDFINQLNNFGGPLTDIDPIPQDQRPGVTPPMMATKSNTRIINLYDEGEDKENCPPPTSDDQDHSKSMDDDFEEMIVKSFSIVSDKNSSPGQTGQTAWMNNLFGEPTPRDQITPNDGNVNSTTGYTPQEGSKNDDTESEQEMKSHPNLPQLRTFTTHHAKSSPSFAEKQASNMPSSPLLTHHEENTEQNNIFANTSSSPTIRATRVNTTTSIMSNSKGEHGTNLGSTPNTDFLSNDDVKENVNIHDLFASKEVNQ